MLRPPVALLLARLLPTEIRTRVFAAAYEELLADFLAARQATQGAAREREERPAERLRPRIAFEIRALLTALECWRLVVADRFSHDFSNDVSQGSDGELSRDSSRNLSNDFSRDSSSDLSSDFSRDPLPAGAAPPPNRAPRRGKLMDALARDLVYAARRLLKAPAFSATAILIIAIGIGANAAAFSIVNVLLFRPLPFARPAELVDIYQDSDGGDPNSSSFPAYRDIAAHTDLFSGVAATAAIFSVNVQQGDSLTRMPVEFSTANYMEVLGLRPAIGRWFDESEDRAGAEAVAVLSHRAWREKLGGDPGVLGTVLRLNGAPVTVVGVGPAGYEGMQPLNSVDMWLSLSSLGSVISPYAMATLEQRGDHWFFIKGRLREGVGVVQVQEAMNALAQHLAAEFPEHNTGRDITVFGAGEVRVHPSVDATLSPSAGVLMAIVGLILLLGCSNLANLLLVRAASRGKEMSIRAALGAGRGQVVRQLLTESVLLSLAGGALGILLAAWAVRGLMSLSLPLPVNISADLSLDGRVLAFALALSALTGIAFGLAPALRASRPELAGAMREEATTPGARGRKFGLRSALVVLQVAVSFVLLVAAGLFIRSLRATQDIDTGFAVDGVAYVQISPSFAGYDAGDARNVITELVERARALPGVENATLNTAMPVTSRGTTTLIIEGYEAPSGIDGVEVPFNTVDTGYFETLRIPLRHGRTFTRADTADGERVAVVSEAMARTYWGESDAVGRRFRSEGAPDSWRRVVGVVGDTTIRDLTENPGPQMYVPWTQSGATSAVVFARAANDPASLVGMLRAELRAIDPDIPVLEAGTMASHLSDSLSVPRLAARFLSGFGLLALVLASLGLYGVVSHAVGSRMTEVGVRMALGARSGQVLWLVLREVVVLVGIGLVVGVGLSLAAGTGVSGVLFGISPTDPVTFAAVAAVLLIVALGAALLPATRAAKADPVLALRQS
ncbi:MAG TPA: ABC transporter permease [Acidobacteriota bacterium]